MRAWSGLFVSGSAPRAHFIVKGVTAFSLVIDFNNLVHVTQESVTAILFLKALGKFSSDVASRG